MSKPRAAITEREKEVLAFVIAGRTNVQIGEELGISPNTVRAHMSRLLAAFNCANRVEMSAKVIREGVLVIHTEVVREQVRFEAVS